MEEIINLDHWFDKFDPFRDFARTCSYEGEVNPVDGVIYPDISTDIPETIKQEIYDKLSHFTGGKVYMGHTFMRLSVEDVHVPQAAHNDVSMGTHALMVYLDNDDSPKTGTALVEHIETGIKGQPQTEEELQIVRKDCSDLSKWRVYDWLAEGGANTAVIFPTYLMHQAHPHGGFGKDSEDGRLVLTCFFDLELPNES
jgi:hypothetical protein